MKWFRQELGSDKSFSDLDKEADAVSPGADGVIFLPYMAGERSPIWNPDAKGVFYGLDFGKTRGHLVRAVLEGVAFSLEHNLITAAEAGVNTEVLLSVGGASNSRVWTQIKADVTGKEIRVPFSDSSTALGAAILAGIGTGVYDSFEEAIQKAVKITKVYYPDKKNHMIYQSCMEKYLELYESLSKQFLMFKI
jgi:xylulokinase